MEIKEKKELFNKIIRSHLEDVYFNYYKEPEKKLEETLSFLTNLIEGIFGVIDEKDVHKN